MHRCFHAGRSLLLAKSSSSSSARTALSACSTSEEEAPQAPIGSWGCFLMQQVIVESPDFGQLFFGCGIDRVEIFAAFWPNEPAVDEKIVTRFDVDVAVRFRRGRIIPAIAEAKTTLIGRQRDPIIDRHGFANNNGARAVFSRCDLALCRTATEVSRRYLARSDFAFNPLPHGSEK